MKRFSVILMLLVSLVAIAGAQPKAVHFKKLQEFLPNKAPQGFERKKPSGQTQTTMGMTTSEASVRFVGSRTEKVKSEETGQMEERSIEMTLEATISDVFLVPFGAAAYMMQTGDYENETEDGYEKSIMYKNFRGKESVSSSEDSKHCELELFVANRFLIKLRGENTDNVKLLHSLLESIDLAKLEKAQPQ